MSDTMLPARTRSDIELAIGVEPIEDVQHNRRKATERNAARRAKYGPGGTFDAERKAYRSHLATEHAERILKERGKPASEAELERLASADLKYRAYLDRAAAEMVDYQLDELTVIECTERINRDQALVRYAANEPK
jgi:ribosomal protein L35